MRRNRGLRAERLFWMAMLLDIAEVAVPYTLLGRIGLRLIRRVAAREQDQTYEKITRWRKIDERDT